MDDLDQVLGSPTREESLVVGEFGNARPGFFVGGTKHAVEKKW